MNHAAEIERLRLAINSLPLNSRRRIVLQAKLVQAVTKQLKSELPKKRKASK